MGTCKQIGTNKTGRQCTFVKTSGERCRAQPVSGSKFCFFHDPKREDECRAARQKGGRSRKLATLPRDTAEFAFNNAEDVVNLLGVTINQVRRGEIDPRVANAVGYLSGIILKAREQGDIEERLRQIEDIVLKGKQGNVTGVPAQAR